MSEDLSNPPALSASTTDHNAEPRKMIVSHWPVGGFHVNDLEAAGNTATLRDLLREEATHHMALKAAVKPVLDFHASLPIGTRWNPKQTVTVPMSLLIDLYFDCLTANDRQLGAGSDKFRPRYVHTVSVEIVAGASS